jgi:enamine deaminase RidA (YjgF/YER057c/UK114 family)
MPTRDRPAGPTGYGTPSTPRIDHIGSVTYVKKAHKPLGGFRSWLEACLLCVACVQLSSKNRHTMAHEYLNPSDLAEPSGFTHAVAAAPGRLVFLSGQIGCDSHGRVTSDSIIEQFDAAAANVIRAVSGAGGAVEDLVQMMIYVTSLEDYRANLKELGRSYRRHFGRRYVASALFEVSGLFNPKAQVEIVCTAVVPTAA